MATLIICAIMLIPQGIAAWRKVGPAAGLSTLLLSLCAVTAILAALTLRAMPAQAHDEVDVYYVVHISAFGFAAIGLCLLTPMYWVVEHFYAHAELRIDLVLAQTIALAFTAAVSSYPTAPMHLLEIAALLVVITLIARGLYLVYRRFIHR